MVYTYTTVVCITNAVALVLTILRMRNPAVRKFFFPAILFAICNGAYCCFNYGVGGDAISSEGGVFFSCLGLYTGQAFNGIAIVHTS